MKFNGKCKNGSQPPQLKPWCHAFCSCNRYYKREVQRLSIQNSNFGIRNGKGYKINSLHQPLLLSSLSKTQTTNVHAQLRLSFSVHLMAMALRPIDNALPNTPERPKKPTKVAVPMQKQTDLGVNDENMAPLPATAEVTIDYISSENLKPISDPDSKIQVTFCALPIR